MGLGEGGAQDLFPRGEALRRAVQWIGSQRLDQPGADVRALVEEAALRFDLSPRDAEFLLRALVPPRPR